MEHHRDSGRSGFEGNVGTRSKNAALFFPRLRTANPLRENQVEDFVSCGAVAGIFSPTDAQRGVWKARPHRVTALAFWMGCPVACSQ